MREAEDRLAGSGTEDGGRGTIDIDLIFYDGLTLDTPDLKLPHPHAHLRRFVLGLSPNNAGKIHPVFGVTSGSCARNSGTDNRLKVGGPSTLFPR
jgi:7,8-dihydro-6-hydroxymethylpterin-pyrophosphokinase